MKRKVKALLKLLTQVLGLFLLFTQFTWSAENYYPSLLNKLYQSSKDDDEFVCLGENPQIKKNETCIDDAACEALDNGEKVVKHNHNYCPEWIKNLDDLPPCNKKGSEVVPENYPPGIFFLNMRNGQAQVEKLMEQILADADPRRPPLISVGAHHTIVTELQEKFSKKYGEKFDLLNIIRSNDLRGSYIQDALQTSVTKKGVHFTQIRNHADLERLNLPPDCGFSGSSHPESVKDDLGTDYFGGNIEALLPGICMSTKITSVHSDLGCTEKNTLISSSYTNMRHIDEYIKVIPNPSKEAPCNFSILVSSTKKAKDLIKEAAQKNPDQYYFDVKIRRDESLGPLNGKMPKNYREVFKNDDFLSNQTAELYSRAFESDVKNPVQHYNEETKQFYHTWDQKTDDDYKKDFKGGYSKMPGFSDICNRYEDLPKIALEKGRDYPRQKEVTLYANYNTKNRVRFYELDGIPSQVIAWDNLTPKEREEFLQEIGLKNEEEFKKEFSYVSQGGDPNDPNYQAIGMDKYCENLSLRDVDIILSQDNRELARAERIEKDNINKIQNLIKKNTKGCQADIIEVPLVTMKGASTLPNPVNGMTISQSSLALPDPYNKVYRDYLEKEFQSRGLSYSWHDMLGNNNMYGNGNDPSLRRKQGNLHCFTNVVHLCSPKGKKKKK